MTTNEQTSGDRADQTSGPDRVEYRMERAYTVDATPEQVWDAIATACGISAWMAPTHLDPRVGGEISFDLGFTSTGIVTNYTPHSRFSYEEPWPAEDGMPTAELDLSAVSPIASEFLIEALSGGSCVIRVVWSAYGIGADWEQEFWDEMIEGTIEILDRLPAYLDR
jgi:uncharacterized protein YndB with AHSA1/START domain